MCIITHVREYMPKGRPSLAFSIRLLNTEVSAAEILKGYFVQKINMYITLSS